MEEELAEYAHAAWAGWMKYMLNGMRGWPNADGSWTISPAMRERWERQMNTPYAKLPEKEKASDREEAKKIIAIVNRHS